MAAIPRLSFSIFLFFSVISPLILSGVSIDASASKTEAKKSSNSTRGPEILFILLGIVAFAGFLFFLYKLYQKRKREEQHARLLRLFAEDDELELELGLRE